jgi:hypothetical protein
MQQHKTHATPQCPQREYLGSLLVIHNESKLIFNKVMIANRSLDIRRVQRKDLEILFFQKKGVIIFLKGYT